MKYKLIVYISADGRRFYENYYFTEDEMKQDYIFYTEECNMSAKMEIMDKPVRLEDLQN